MSFFKTIPQRYLWIMVAAALLNVSPFLFRHVGADIWFYLVWMRCFSEQLWQGDLYPRWCMDVNGGLGTPLFLFYFPLPFYIAAPFQPLIQLGLSYYDLFSLLCFLSNVFALITCFLWLKDIVEQRYALIASILFIFMPYHLEMMFFRGAYSEIWVFGLLPLLFKYTRRVAKGDKQYLLKLAFVIGLSLLTHIPVTAEALLFSGLYVLVTTGKTWRPVCYYILAVAWGVGLALFYLAPGIYYHQFLASSILAQGLYGWPNNFLSLDFLKIPGLDRPLLACILTVLLLAGFTTTMLIKYRRISDNFIRREAVIWISISALALFMLFPMSGPIYALMGPFSKIVFPWRMQAIITLGITYLLAVWMQWLIPPGRRKTWKLDFGLAIVTLWVVSNVLVASFSSKGDALNEQIRSAKIVFAPEYRSLWTNTDHWEYQYLLGLTKKTIQKAEIIVGKGTVKVQAWGWHGIELEVQGAKPVTLRLHHIYFPGWEAMSDKNEALSLHPEDKTGLMLLEVPAGNQHITLAYHVNDGVPGLIASQCLSLLAWIGIMTAYIRFRYSSGRDKI